MELNAEFIRHNTSCTFCAWNRVLSLSNAIMDISLVKYVVGLYNRWNYYKYNFMSFGLVWSRNSWYFFFIQIYLNGVLLIYLIIYLPFTVRNLQTYPRK